MRFMVLKWKADCRGCHCVMFDFGHSVPSVENIRIDAMILELTVLHFQSLLLVSDHSCYYSHLTFLS